MNSDGVAVFGGFNSLPTAIAGGFAYSASNFYAGIE
jgi:branched-subunit amino acid ABC-type transport system permease component